MVRTIRRTPTDQADALACWSAVLLLRVDPATAMADAELAPQLAGLLSAVSQELETGRESVPKTVRCAAVQLAAHIARRSVAVTVPPRPGGADEPLEHPAQRAERTTGVPFSRSIRLGRMG
jgi:hypothetical protein